MAPVLHLARQRGRLQCMQKGLWIHSQRDVAWDTASAVPCRAYASPATGLKIGWIGAGGVNFGTAEGPWNHCARVNKLPGVTFSCIVDPNKELAQQRVREQQAGPAGDKWADCQVFGSHKDMLAAGPSKGRPEAVIIGIPPHLHGSIDVPEKAMELELAHEGVHMLVEKPISMQRAEEVERLGRELKRVAEQKRVVVAVGYMLRHSAAYEQLLGIMKQHDIQPRAIVGRYSCPYDHIEKTAWWDVQRSGGPIVEQATHFVDIARYIAGAEVDYASIMSHAVGPDMELSKMPRLGEQDVPWEQRNNRATVAIWKFRNGMIGSLSHTLLLHGSTFFAEMDVFADGFHAIVQDPYQNPGLLVRLPNSQEYKKVPLSLDKDMYDKQFENWVEAVRNVDQGRIRSSFDDAAKTYASTWMITQASGTKPPGS